MSPRDRLSARERREKILAASMDLFAEHGLHGVTTRMIADAAAVSEALLYRHFRGKEELFSELQRWCLKGTMSTAEKIAELEPSTSTLVLAVHFTVNKVMCAGSRADLARMSGLKRMMLTSLTEDGSFARGFLQANFARFIKKFVECIEAAADAGDMVDRPKRPVVRVWLMHHLGVMASCYLLPAKPVIDYGVDADTLVQEITRFALRGIGLKEEALKRHFNPKAIALFTQALDTGSQQTLT